MPANFNPIFTIAPDVSNNQTTGFGGTLQTATGDYTGVSANYILVHTAGTNGSYIKRLRFKATGSTTNATVARIFINNGSVNTTATNNIFYGELSLPIVAGINTAATVDLDYPMEFAIDGGYRIYVGLGTTVTPAGWICTAIAGQY
jgi:hypothetical protein